MLLPGYYCIVAKVKIYGEIISHEDASLAEMGYSNLSSLQNQLEGLTGDIIVAINSVGGDVDTGFAMYSELRRYAKEQNAKVTTISEGKCASIATIVFLAGDERIVNRYIDPFVHNAWTFAVGDSGELTKVAADLESVNEKLAKFYAEHTNLTYEEARELMDAETNITPEEAVNIRFATKIEEVMRPVALQRVMTSKSKSKAMSKSEDSKIVAKLRAIFAKDAKNLEVFTSTNDALVFDGLEEGETPKVGDRATIDGKAADGEYTLQDGTVYRFEQGELVEIIEKDAQANAVDAVEELKEEVQELEKENEELKEEVEELKEELEAQAKQIKSILAQQKEDSKRWNKMKALVSNVTVDDKDDKDKGPNNKKKGLAGAAGRLNKKK